MTARPHKHAKRGSTRRGMTLLEAVLATLLLGFVGAAFLGALSNIWRSQIRQSQRLAAAETANRLVLQYLDNRGALDAINGRPIAYGSWSFRWELNEEPVTFVPPPGEAGVAAQRRLDRGISGNFNRIKHIRVRVWLDERNLEGGSFRPTPDTPQVTLSRLVDPLNLDRNPDSFKKLMQNPGSGSIAEILSLDASYSVGSEQSQPAPN